MFFSLYVILLKNNELFEGPRDEKSSHALNTSAVKAIQMAEAKTNKRDEQT